MDTPLEENSTDDNLFEENQSEISQQDKKEGAEDHEIQIRELIEIMKQCLSQAGRPKFKEFWDARVKCVDLLKLPMGLGARHGYWSEVTALSKEARNLKQFFDRDVSFEIDQIQLAFQSLEQQINELTSSDRRLALLPENSPEYINVERDFFEVMQSKLQHMQGMLSQVQALRKEILTSSIRAKTKTAMLDRSSSLLDILFSHKRDWTAQISDRFINLVERFVLLYPKGVALPKAPHEIKDEIKILQALGKAISITPDTFLKTRETLSLKWDEIKEIEAAHRETVALKKSAYKSLIEEFSKEADAFGEYCLTDEATVQMVEEKHKALFDQLKTKEMDRETFKSLKNQLMRAREPFDQKIAKQINEQREEAEKADAELRKRFHELKTHFEDLLQKHEEMPLEHLQNHFEKAKEEIANAKFANFHSQVLDHLSFQLQDVIQHAKDKQILKLSKEDKDAHDQLSKLYEEKQKQRAELKKQLEVSRKHLGTSGLDFEKAMALREKIEIEKQSFDRLSTLIDEIEDKLSDLQNK